jgi:hypothetical protein
VLQKWFFSEKGDFLIIRDPIYKHGSGNLLLTNLTHTVF